MLTYIVRRILLLIPMVMVISVVIFIIIQLPPGDYLTSYITNLRTSGIEVSESQAEALKQQYGLDQPAYVQYLLWMKNMVLYGDFGRSFQWNKPVKAILMDRVPLTMAISLATTLFVFAVAIPIGVYSATHKYSTLDYTFTFVGFFGLSVPGFLLALVLMWVIYSLTGATVSGLFSAQYADAPWSVGKLGNLMSRIWFPMIIIGMSGTAGLIRVMRGNLLDELQKQYVVTARERLARTRGALPLPGAHRCESDHQHHRLGPASHRER